MEGSDPSEATERDASWAVPDPGAPLHASAPTRSVARRPSRVGGSARRRPVEVPVPLRPLTITGVLDAAFALIKRRPATLLGLVAAVITPVFALSALARPGMFRPDIAGLIFDETGAMDDAWSTDGWLLVGSATLLAEMLATFIAGVLVATVVAGWYAGVDLTPREVFSRVLGLWWAILGAFAITAAAKGVGLLACVVGVILPLTWFAPTAAVVAVERLGPLAAIKRAAQLTARRFDHALGVVCGGIVVAELCRVALMVLPWDLLGGMPGGAVGLSRFLLTLAVQVLLVTFTACLATVLYVGLRVRTEGLDLELEATEVFPTDAH